MFEEGALELHVEEDGYGAEAGQAEPDAHEVEPVGQHDRDWIARPHALRGEEAGHAHRIGGGLRVGELGTVDGAHEEGFAALAGLPVEDLGQAPAGLVVQTGIHARALPLGGGGIMGDGGGGGNGVMAAPSVLPRTRRRRRCEPGSIGGTGEKGEQAEGWAPAHGAGAPRPGKQ